MSGTKHRLCLLRRIRLVAGCLRRGDHVEIATQTGEAVCDLDAHSGCRGESSTIHRKRKNREPNGWAGLLTIQPQCSTQQNDDQRGTSQQRSREGRPIRQDHGNRIH